MNRSATTASSDNRAYFSRHYAQRCCNLAQQLLVKNNMQFLTSFSLKTLLKLLSTIHNKNISSTTIFDFQKISKKQDFDILSQPTATITTEHQKIKTMMSNTDIEHLSRLIINQVNLLRIKKPAKNFSFKYADIIPLVFSHPALAKIDFRRTFRIANQFLPPPLNTVMQPTHIFRNLPALSILLFNEKRTIKQINDNLLRSLPPCSCNLPIFNAFKNVHGHVDTNDLEILNVLPLPHFENDVREFVHDAMAKGTNFVPRKLTDASLILADLTHNIDVFTEKACSKYKINPTLFAKWRCFILDATRFHVTSLVVSQSSGLSFQHPRVRSFVRNVLQNRFVLTATDKMKNNFRITCKSHYILRLHQHISGQDFSLSNPGNIPTNIHPSSPYQPTNKTLESTVASHKETLHSFGIRSFAKLPLKYIIMKPHKDGVRPITAAFNVTTTYASKIMSVALKAIINELNVEASEFQLKYGTSYNFIIETAKQSNALLQSLNKFPGHQPQCVQAFDIDGFYNNIPIKKTIKILKHLVPIVFARKMRYLRIKLATKTSEWSASYKSEKYKTFCFDEKTLLKLLTWKLQNQQFFYKGLVLNQVTGIGQGDNHSPDIANIVGLYYERKFIRYHTFHNLPIAKTFSLTTRKLDDTLFINNRLIHRFIYKDQNNKHGLYPRKYFTLTSPSATPQNSVEYLDTFIHIIKTPDVFVNNVLLQFQTYLQKDCSKQDLADICRDCHIPSSGKKSDLIRRIILFRTANNALNYIPNHSAWNTKTYSKTKKLALNAITFPHFSSNVPFHVKMGCFTGRLHAFVISNMLNVSDFLQITSELILKLVTENNYPLRPLVARLFRFLRLKKFIYNQPTSSIIQLFRKVFFPRILQERANA